MTENNYSPNFEIAIQMVWQHEGLLSTDHADPGGLTKYGISQKSYPDLDIANLTQEQAKAIYHKDFWLAHNYDALTDQTVQTKVFDLAVNMGATTAHKLIQRALRSVGRPVPEDGILGPQTRTAINSAISTSFIAALKSESAGYYRLLAATKPPLTKYLNGWLARAYD